MAKVLIVDVGNSKTKCYVFDVNPTRRYYEPINCLHEESMPTPRQHPYDLVDTCSILIRKALRTETVDVGMVTAFGDAFIHYDKSAKKPPYFVFADEPADDLPEFAYNINGWPRNFQLSSVRALQHKHKSAWQNMYSPNTWITSQLCGKESDDPWNAWDITQASISGLFDLKNQKWIYSPVFDPNLKRYKGGIVPPIQSHKQVGRFDGITFLAGGLDNAFVDTQDMNPYIVAGTWLVLGVPFDENYDATEFTDNRLNNTVRWLISGNSKYHAQVVRKVSNPITQAERKQILIDFEILGLESRLEKDEDGFTQRIKPRVKVFGGYGEALADALQEMSRNIDFYTVGPNERTDLYQHQMSALFVHNHYRRKEWKPASEKVRDAVYGVNNESL